MQSLRVQATGKDHGMRVDRCLVEYPRFGREGMKSSCKMKDPGLPFVTALFVLFLLVQFVKTSLALQASPQDRFHCKKDNYIMHSFADRNEAVQSFVATGEATFKGFVTR